jgi:hypothetical protein
MLPAMLRFGAVFLAAISLGCAVDKDDGEPLNRPDSGGLTADVLSIDGSSDTFIDRDAACGIETAQANVTPLNLYVMFDKSSSMGPETTSTKWAGARKGMAAFVNDTASSGLRIALNFFPRPVDSTPACDSAAYKTPRVAYDLLPANAGKIIGAIEAEKPDGFNTPIYPALGGALRASIDQLAARPGEASAVVLITDGEPQGPAAMCGSVNPEDPAVIANLANTAFMNNGVRTFVVGLPGVNVSVANQIAAGGGTTAAVLATDPTKVEESFRDALAVVRGKALPCELNLPTKVLKGEISYALVNVLYSKGGGGTPATLLQDPTCASGDGWRYDNPSMPTKIVLCPKTCGEVQADPKAKVEILLGCSTAIR